MAALNYHPYVKMEYLMYVFWYNLRCIAKTTAYTVCLNLVLLFWNMLNEIDCSVLRHYIQCLKKNPEMVSEIANTFVYQNPSIY